jgi:hypothetical protein
MESTSQPSNSPMRDHLVEQCEAMVNHALGHGLDVPGTVVQTIEACKAGNGPEGGFQSDVGVDVLAQAHQRLAKLVAPATPQAIAILDKEAAKGGILRLFGAVPLVRQLMLLATIFLVFFVALAATAYVTEEPGKAAPGTAETDSKPKSLIKWSVYESSGTEMLVRLMFLISAAGLGACFASLFRVNRFMVNRTYDPAHGGSYLIRLLTGVIAGVVLSEMVPIDEASLENFHAPILALLGGFSGNTVYRILERLVQSVESVVGGDIRGVADAEIRAAKSDAMREAAEQRVAITAKVASVQQQLGTTDGVANAKQQLGTLMTELGQTETLPPTPPSKPA